MYHHGSQEPINKIKVTFLGEQMTGKTSCIRNLTGSDFDPTYNRTVGIDFLKLKPPTRPALEYMVWDTAGEDRFRSLIPSYIRDSIICILVFDITRRDTLFSARVDGFVEAMNINAPDSIKLLLGMMADLHDDRAVTHDEGEKYAIDHDMFYMEYSAKDGLPHVLHCKIFEMFDKI